MSERPTVDLIDVTNPAALKVGDHLYNPTWYDIVYLTERKTDGTGWWVGRRGDKGGGLADQVIADAWYLIVTRVVTNQGATPDTTDSQGGES